MSLPKVSIIIVTWNSKNYINDALSSIMNQTYKDFLTMMIDNNSMNGTVNIIRNNYPNAYIIQNFKNTGFSKAHNQGIKLTSSEYILVMNPDVMLDKNFLSTLISFADKHPRAGSFTGKIYKLIREKVSEEERSEELHYNSKSDIIDAAGLIMRKDHIAINRGEGQSDSETFAQNEKIFGAPGCLALYRRKALIDIENQNEFFDEIFFAYKEDVDLSWRLNIHGWDSWYIPDAIAYHNRGFPITQGKNIMQAIAERKKIPKKLRYLSFRNQYLMMIKNDTMANVLAHLPYIFIKMAKDVFLLLCIEPFQWKNIVEIPKLFFVYLRKRKINLSQSKVLAKDMKKWFL